MSKKTKLGRNPFQKGGAAQAEKKTAPKKRAAAAGTPKNRLRPSRERVFRRGKGKGFAHLLNDVTRYWIPRVRACAYLRVVKFVSKKFA